MNGLNFNGLWQSGHSERRLGSSQASDARSAIVLGGSEEVLFAALMELMAKITMFGNSKRMPESDKVAVDGRALERPRTSSPTT